MSKALIQRQVYEPGMNPVVKQSRLDRLVETLMTERGYPVEVIVQRMVKARSNHANSYLWNTAYRMLSEESGYEREELHVEMCKQWFGTRTIEIMGQVREVPVRTTTVDENGEKNALSGADFWDFTDYVIRMAADWYGIAVPPADPSMRRT